GDYLVSAPIILRKRSGGLPCPLSLVGEGPGQHGTANDPDHSLPYPHRNGSCLRWVSMDTTLPMLTYHPQGEPYDTYFHTIENLSFVRGDGFGPGTIFSHPATPGGGNGGLRWRSSTIRNCFFWTNEVAGIKIVEIGGAWNSVVADVMIEGGD